MLMVLCCLTREKKNESLPCLREAKRPDPLSPAVWLEDLAECHYMLGNYQCAIDLYLRWRNLPLHTYTHLAACYSQLGRITERHKAVANYEQRTSGRRFPALRGSALQTVFALG